MACNNSWPLPMDFYNSRQLKIACTKSGQLMMPHNSIQQHKMAFKNSQILLMACSNGQTKQRDY